MNLAEVPIKDEATLKRVQAAVARVGGGTMKKVLFMLALAGLVAGAASAQPLVRQPTQEEIDAARGFARFRERIEFLDGLFELGRVPKSCKLELIDPAGQYVRSNLVLTCPEPLTVCDARGIDCV